MEERFVAKRYINVILMFLVTLVFTAVLCLKEGVWLDQMVCLVVLDMIFLLLFLFILEHNRMLKIISGNKETNYRKVFMGYALLAGVSLLCSFFPEFTKPVIILPILMTLLCNVELAFCTSAFFMAELAIVMNITTMELVSSYVMILFGCMVARAIDTHCKKLWYGLVILCLSITVPMLFYYLHYQEYYFPIMIWGCLEGIVIGIFLHFSAEKILSFRNLEVAAVLVDVLDEDFPLIRELKRFSRQEYKHARRVSDISKRCAKLVNANEQICAAAAFYYRIGIIDGDEIQKNGVRIAENHCFPEDITRIIYEYYGVEQPPSTIESAIVQMVDAVVKKIEVFDPTTMSSNWNQDMVIYQTLNEYSAQGMYDKSGLSMNMFLKIREYLVNEEVLV